MFDNLPLVQKRWGYFQQVANLISKINVQLIVVTHVCGGEEFFTALSSIATLALVIAIPYSLQKAAQHKLSARYKIITPSLTELTNPQLLARQVLAAVNHGKATIILEIGGYFASTLSLLQEKLQENLIGVVEDTETGHRLYEKLSSFPCPIISVARSPLKRAEDSLIGDVCLFSTEQLLRKIAYSVKEKNTLVLGFGKIGQGLARLLSRKSCHVAVHDYNATQQIMAVSEGFPALHKQRALMQADMIFGTTGNYAIQAADFPHIKSGAILVSCSSKDIEFDVAYLKANYQEEVIFPNYTKYTRHDRHLYLLANGYPVNFLDGSLENSPLGPVLALVQAEIILAVREIMHLHTQGKKGMFEMSAIDRKTLATMWLQHFCDPVTGHYS